MTPTSNTQRKSGAASQMSPPLNYPDPCPDSENCRNQTQGLAHNSKLCGVWVPDDPPFNKPDSAQVMYHTRNCSYMKGRLDRA